MSTEKDNSADPAPSDRGVQQVASSFSAINTAPNNGVQGTNYGSVTITTQSAPAALSDPIRALMIRPVRTIWIEGLLNRSLYREVQLRPGLRSDPARVELPMRMLVQEAAGSAEDLPEGTPIADVYDRFGGALLILGAPGAGKTTLLLELARDLLDRAEADPAYPIPVVFPLSTWAAERKPLHQWLVDQLVLLYHVRRKIAQSWVDADRVLPLLDGLDEVGEAQRADCVQAINAFRVERGTLPLVVCSRLQEFDAVAQVAGALMLHGAVVVQTLRRAAVLEALAALGPEATLLRDTLVANERDWLWSVATSPLGLSVLVPAVLHDPKLLHTTGSDAEKRNSIFAAYVDAMFARKAAPTQWPREETSQRLSWLAAQMQARGQTLFLLESLQPDWLPLAWQKVVVQRSFVLVSTLFLGLIGGLAVILGRGLVDGLEKRIFIGVNGGLIFGFFVGVLIEFTANSRNTIDLVE